MIGAGAGITATGSDEAVLIGYLAGDAINNNNADGTVAIGWNAAGALTNGVGNTAIGYQALLGHTTGSYNTVLGFGAMDGTAGDANDAPASIYNTFIGYDAGGGDWVDDEDSNYNTAVGALSMNAAMDAALYNTAHGYNSLGGLTDGGYNTMIGALAGDAITGSDYNTAIGWSALSAACNSGNTAVGYSAGVAITGESNTIVGKNAMFASANIDRCTAIGSEALYNVTTDDGDGTVAIGWQAGYGYVPADTGDPATAGTTLIGYQAGYYAPGGGETAGGLTTGRQNTAVGHETLGANAGDGNALTGAGNTVMGYRAGYVLKETAQYNTLIGNQSGYANITGDYNVAIGHVSGDSVTTGNGNVAIGGYSDNASTAAFQTAVGYAAVTQNAYETRIGTAGGLQFYSVDFEATVTDATEFNVANTGYMFKIPAFAFIKSISATCLVLHGDATADFMIVRSVDSAGADGELLSDNGAFLELLGAGADGTINTGNLNSGGAYDLQAGSGTGNVNQVWYNEKVANLNTANHATETADSYIWLLNAGSSNEDANNATRAKWRVCVEFIGQD